jgi:ribosomal protein S20
MTTIPNLLSLFGGSSSGSTGGTGSALTDYAIYQKNGARQFEDFKKQKLIQKAVDDFRAALANVKSPDEFVKNRKVMDFAMKAFGLGTATEDYGLTRRAITQDLDDKRALANRLTDSRYKTITKAFDFANSGVDKLADKDFVDDLVKRFLQNEFERSIGEKNSAVRDAIVFRRNVGDITRTVDILGNGILRRVVTKTLQLPDEIAIQSVQKNIADIDKRIDTRKFMLNPTGGTTGTSSLSPAQRLANANTALSVADNTRSIVDSVVSQISQLEQDYANLDATFAANAADAPLQQANLPEAVQSRGAYSATIGALGQATGNFAAAINAVDAAIQAIDAGSNDPTFGGAAQYQRALDRITLVRDQVAAPGFGAYDGESLAVAGAAPGTFTNGTYVAKTISFTSAMSVDVKVHDLQPTLDLANTALGQLGGYDPATARDQLVAARAALVTAQSSTETMSGALASELESLNQGFGAIAGYAVPIATSDVYRGQKAVTAAQSALTSISDTVTQMRVLALQLSDPAYAGDRAAADDQFKTLAAKLGTQLASADYADAVGGDTRNLLKTTGDYTYNLFADGSATIKASSVSLDAMIDPFAADAQAGILSLGDAAGAMNALDRIGQLQAALGEATTSIEGQAKAFGVAAYDIDPRGKLDARYRTLAQFASTSVALATFNKTNLLSAGATDVAINSTDVPGDTVLKAYPQMSTGVADVLTSGAAALPGTGPFDQTNPARVALMDALIAAQGVQNQLMMNRSAIVSIRDAAQKQNPDSASSTTNDPFNVKATAFTDQFIRRYLITVDSQNSATAQASGSYNSALSLLQGATGGGSNLFSI